MMNKNPIFCAIDTTDMAKAKSLIAAVAPHVGGIKLGLEFFVRHGASGVRDVLPDGIKLFLDLKFHDIPNTVAGAVRAIGDLPVHMLTVHASGGMAMMKAAKAAALMLPSQPKVIGVSVLTSMDAAEAATIGVVGEVALQVNRLVSLAQESGLDGAVCSSHEVAMLRTQTMDDFLLVVPGIRPAGTTQNDQKRVMTPQDAMNAGASYLVVGRPITESQDPAKTAADIAASL